jgi:hypothetical protein
MYLAGDSWRANLRYAVSSMKIWEAEVCLMLRPRNNKQQALATRTSPFKVDSRKRS